MKYFRRLKITKKTFELLCDLARKKDTGTYREEMSPIASRSEWGLILGKVNEFCYLNGWPLLGSLMVLKTTKVGGSLGTPSYGFEEMELVQDLMQKAGITDIDVWIKREQQRCFDFWENK